MINHKLIGHISWSTIRDASQSVIKGLSVNIPIATNLQTPNQMWLYTGILFVDSPDVMVNLLKFACHVETGKLISASKQEVFSVGFDQGSASYSNLAWAKSYLSVSACLALCMFKTLDLLHSMFFQYMAIPYQIELSLILGLNQYFTMCWITILDTCIFICIWRIRVKRWALGIKDYNTNQVLCSRMEQLTFWKSYIEPMRSKLSSLHMMTKNYLLFHWF